MKAKIFCVVMALFLLTDGSQSLFGTASSMLAEGFKGPIAPVTLATGRLLGAFMLGWAILFWMIRNRSFPEIKPIISSYMVITALLIILMFHGLFFAGVATKLVYVGVVINCIILIWGLALLRKGK